MDIIFLSFHLIKVTRSWKCWTLKKTRKIFLLYVKKHGHISLYNKIFKQNEWMLIGCQEIWLLWHPLDMKRFYDVEWFLPIKNIASDDVCPQMPFLSWTGLSVKTYNRVDSQVSEKMILFSFFDSFCRRAKAKFHNNILLFHKRLSALRNESKRRFSRLSVYLQDWWI